MYQVYLLTGVLLLLAGTITSICLLWFIKSHKYERSFVLFLAQAIGITFMGAFYVYCEIAMFHNFNDYNEVQEIPLLNIIHSGQYFDLAEYNNNHLNNSAEQNEFGIGFGEVLPAPNEYTDEIANMNDDFTTAIEENQETTSAENLNYSTTTAQIKDQDRTSQFLYKYKQFLKDMLNKTTFGETVLNNRRRRTLNNQTNQGNSENVYTSKCSFQNIFLQHSLITYSFVHGLVALINTAVDCKDCEENKKGDNSNQSTSTKEPKQKKKVQQKLLQNHKKLIVQLFTILIPPICASSLYYTMQNQETIPTSSTNFNISKILQNPINISTVANLTQVNGIVRNIYEIITEVKTNSHPVIPKVSFVYRSNSSEKTSDCYTPSMSLQVYTFIVFIVGYFAAMLYSQAAYTKMGLKENTVKVRNLKVGILGFGTLWLPAALELFLRIYIKRSTPSLFAELFTALGNLSHILMSISNLLMTKSVIKKENHVQPIV